MIMRVDLIPMTVSWIDDKYFHAFINHIIIHYCYYFKCFAIVSH